MVISEKTLVREIKAAYKGGGYVVISRPGGRTAFWTPQWTVEIDTDNLPREVLALLDLHMGCLPEEGSSCSNCCGACNCECQKNCPDI